MHVGKSWSKAKTQKHEKISTIRQQTNIDYIRDHASLFIMSPPLAQILEENGTASPTKAIDPDTLKPMYSQDEQRPRESLHRTLATNIYRTQDNRFYHVHG